MSSVNTNSNFRYDINALRAIAVLGVVMFHYKVPGFGGGFCGVDIFFVISGYLMSRIIINGIGKGNFSVLDFYIRRAKRIIPALLVLVAVMSCVAFFLYFPEDYKTNEGNAASSLVFLSNIYYMLHSGYFAADAESNIFLHTWSLSVEWQFYLIYPLILLLILKRPEVKKLNYIYFLSVTAFLCLISIYYTKYHPTEFFYLLPSRAWEMLFGGVALLSEPWFAKFRYKNIAAILGYTVLAFCIILIPTSANWPSKITIVPVLTTCLIIAANFNDFKLIKLTALQSIGKMSYSVYLWHWPIYVVALYLGYQSNWEFIIGLIAISFVLGYLSFRYIEPVRERHGKYLFLFAFTILIMTSFASLNHSNSFIFKKNTAALANFSKTSERERENQFSEGSCFISRSYKTENFNQQSCLHIDTTKRNILLIGDSHAAHFSQSFKEAFSQQNINLLQVSASGGFPFIRPNGDDRCKVLMELVFKIFIPKNAKRLDGVVLSANWLSPKTGSNDQLVNDLQSTIKYLQSYKIKYIIIGQNESYRLDYPIIAAREYENGTPLANKFKVEAGDRLNNYLKKTFGPSYVDIYNSKSTPEVSQQLEPYMFDKQHLTKYGADLATQRIITNPSFKQLLIKKSQY